MKQEVMCLLLVSVLVYCSPNSYTEQNACGENISCNTDLDCLSGLCQENLCSNPPNTNVQLHERQAVGDSWNSGDFSNGLDPWNVEISAYGESNRAFVNDPAGSEIVLRVQYPKGSRNPKVKPVGGTGFYATPIDITNANSVEFSFQLFPPLGFDWVKGGKLPGLYGGKRSCSGGKAALACFSTRFMWRKEGLGEMYVYVAKKAQTKDYCRIPPLTVCNSAYGDSLGRGAFAFKEGEWNTIRQIITLNTFSGRNPNQDGKFLVYFGGSSSPVIEFNEIVWRTLPTVGFLGIDFETFFGGSDKSWVTPTDQELYFKDFSLSALQ